MKAVKFATALLCTILSFGNFATATVKAPHARFVDGNLGNTVPKGWIREFLDRQVSGLSGHPEAMSYPYNTNLWNGPIERMSDHGAGWWRYEQTAYYSDGLLRLGYALDNGEFIRKVEDGIRYTIANARPDGEIGADDVLNDKRRFMWPQAVFFRAMKAMYDKTQDPSIPSALEKYFLHYTPQQVSMSRNVVNVEGILWTYGITGNKALLDLAEAAYAAEKYELKPKYAFAEGCLHLHGVTYCEEMKLPALLYMWTGNEKYRRIAEGLEEKLVSCNLLPDGVPSSVEHLMGNSIDNGHETCDIADFTWSEGYFLEMSGDGRYADRIEKAVFNAAPGAMTKDFKAIQYFSNVNQFNVTGDSDPNAYFYGSTWQAYRPTHETECCVGNVHRIMPNYVSRMWLSDGKGGVVAALYGPCELHIDGMTIEEQTQYPFEGTVRFVFHPAKAKSLPFSFRIPGWCGKYSLTFNGREMDVKAAPGEFATIKRRFRDGDSIELSFDMPPRASYPAGQGICFERGALLFSYHIPTKWTVDEKDYANMRGKKSGNPDFKCWTLNPAGKFNYQSSDVEPILVKNDVPEGAYPFDNPPYSIRINVNEVDWPLKDGKFTGSLPPVNAKKYPDRKASLDLVPYGCTELRLTVFPLHL